MKRLHKQGAGSMVKMSRLHCITPWQGRKPSVLSEELLLTQKREEKTCVFVPPSKMKSRSTSGLRFLMVELV